MTSLICNDNFKYWLALNWDEEHHVSTSSYVRYGNDGRYGYYNFDRGGQFLPSEEDDIIYPNHWELKDNSTIVFKNKQASVPERSRDVMYEKKIVYLTKDTIILSYSSRYYPEKVYRDTLVTPPDSINELIGKDK
jgi:hypothetical protein